MDLYAIVTLVIAGLVALTNIIVQALKKVTWEKLDTNFLALIVAMILTLAAGIAFLQIKAIAITWWMVAVLIVAGFVVAYAAMVGFDKLWSQVEEWWGRMKDKVKIT